MEATLTPLARACLTLRTCEAASADRLPTNEPLHTNAERYELRFKCPIVAHGQE